MKKMQSQPTPPMGGCTKLILPQRFYANLPYFSSCYTMGSKYFEDPNHFFFVFAILKLSPTVLLLDKPAQDLRSLEHHICYFDLPSYDNFFSVLPSINKVVDENLPLWTSLFSSDTLFLEGSTLNFSSPKISVK